MAAPRPIRPAATVVVVRPGPRGPEVAVLRRASRQRFLAGYVVFPGGAIDADDAGLAHKLFGDAAEASRACAVREVVEEVGILVTATGAVEASADQARAVSEAAAVRLPVAVLPEISRWVAPEDVPVRFDARFYAVEAPRGLELRPDGTETERAWWARPSDLLEAAASGGCTLYWPTMKVMEGLARCGSVAEVLLASIPQEEPQVQVVG